MNDWRLRKSEIRNEEARNLSAIRHPEYFDHAQHMLVSGSYFQMLKRVQHDEPDGLSFGFSDLEFSALPTTVDFFLNGINE